LLDAHGLVDAIGLVEAIGSSLYTSACAIGAAIAAAIPANRVILVLLFMAPLLKETIDVPQQTRRR
jgi:hypothetical protein